MFDSLLGAIEPILEAYAAVADEESQQNTTANSDDGTAASGTETDEMSPPMPSARANNARNNFMLTFATYGRALAEGASAFHDHKDAILGTCVWAYDVVALLEAFVFCDCHDQMQNTN